jgi:hypothetical protein
MKLLLGLLVLLLSSSSSIEEDRQRLRRKRRKLIRITGNNEAVIPDRHGVDSRELETSKAELEDAFIKLLFDSDQSIVAIPISFGVVIDFAKPAARTETPSKLRELSPHVEFDREITDNGRLVPESTRPGRNPAGDGLKPKRKIIMGATTK